jgi:hypothetical protein
MDGRPHPPKEAPHTLSGFTTGVWEGNVLTTYTTHMKTGYLRRNGVPNSDEATMTMHWMRHGDILTVSGHIDDPIYLTEPYVLSRSWELDTSGRQAWPPKRPCTPQVEVPRLTGGAVPHYLPGKNPFVNEIANLYNLPVEAVMGGAETTYPEYRKKLKDKYVPPEKCTRYCCGWEDRVAFDRLHCIIGGSVGDPNSRP